MTYVFCKYFFSVCDLSSHSFDMSFAEQKFLILKKSSLSMVSFMDHGVACKKSLPYPRSCRFSPMSSFRIFIVLHSAFMFCDPFWVNLCERCLDYYFFYYCLHVDIQLFQRHLLKRLFAPLHCLCTFVKDQFDCT